MNQPSLVFLGDEDRAMSHAPEALAIFHAGRKDAYLEDDTHIYTVGSTVYIHAEFHPEFSLFTPVDIEGSPGLYRMRRLGLEHRKDGMTPMGLYSHATSSDVSYPLKTGVELIYCADGIAFSSILNLTEPLVEKADVQNFIFSLSVLGITEDLLQGGSDTVSTPQGFKNANIHTYAIAAMLTQLDTLHSVAPYGVNRAGAYPTYTVAVGHAVHTDFALKDSAFDNGSGTDHVKYYEVYQALTYLTAGRGISPASNSLGLGVDVIEEDADYIVSGVFLQAPYPVVIPLGNQRVFILYRERIADGTKIFGGKFKISAYLMSGSGLSFTVPSVAGITAFLDTPAGYNCGTVGGGYTIPQDALRVQHLFESLGAASRTAVPVSQTETLIFGRKNKLDVATTVKWICYSVGTTGIVEKSTPLAFFDTPDPVTPRDQVSYDYRGAVHLGGTKVVAYFFKSTWAIGATSWSEAGMVRLLSTDDGASWGAEQLCSFTSEDDNDGMVLSEKPIYIGETAAGDSIVALGFADRGAVDATHFVMKNAKVMTSVDDGLTFTQTHSAAGPLEFTAEGGLITSGETAIVGNYFNKTNGMLALTQHGTPMNGFAPSPYKHLPTYYGTAAKASRDSSNDEGL